METLRRKVLYQCVLLRDVILTAMDRSSGSWLLDVENLYVVLLMLYSKIYMEQQARASPEMIKYETLNYLLSITLLELL